MNQVNLTISAGQKEPGSFRLVFTLALAGMLSGLALAGAYQITKPIIDANNAEALRRGVFEVVPGSTRFTPVELVDGQEKTTAYATYDADGAFLGYAMEGRSVGFADTIWLLWGYEPQRRRVTGMKVLDSRETPGLGDKIKKEKYPPFAGQFADLAIEPMIIVVKDGRDEDNEIDAITGATISSKAVAKAINDAAAKWLAHLPATPPPPPPDSAESQGPGLEDKGEHAGEGG